MRGLIYEKVAKKCVYEKDNQLDDIEVTSMIYRSNYEKVGIRESIDIKKPLENAIDSLANVLSQKDIKLAPDLVSIVFYSQIPNTVLLDSSDIVHSRRFSEMQRAEIALKTLADIHDGWAKVNARKFPEWSYRDRQFIFMPAELIGFDELMKNYLFIEDTLAVLGLKTGVYNLQKCHMKMWQDYKKHYDIKGVDALAKHLVSLEEDDLAPGIWEELKNPDTARRVANQIALVNDIPLVW